jgi:uncharacterized membrane protein
MIYSHVALFNELSDKIEFVCFSARKCGLLKADFLVLTYMITGVFAANKLLLSGPLLLCNFFYTLIIPYTNNHGETFLKLFFNI